MDFHDYQVDLLDLDGRGTYNLGYQTFDKKGERFVDWRLAKLAIPKEQRLALWPAILESLRKLVQFVEPQKLMRRIPLVDADHHRDTEVTQLLLTLGYEEVKRLQQGPTLVRFYRKT
jgi:hypothetical protein